MKYVVVRAAGVIVGLSRSPGKFFSPFYRSEFIRSTYRIIKRYL